MKHILSFFLLLCSLVLLSACTTNREQTINPEYSEPEADDIESKEGDANYPLVQDDYNEPINVSMIACSNDEECPLPYYYAQRSSCPYDATCLEGRCAVVCQEPYPSAEAEANQEVQCVQDADCDCTFYVSTDSKGCTCIEGRCSVVVTE